MFLFLHTTPQKRHKLPNENQLTDHNTDAKNNEPP